MQILKNLWAVPIALGLVTGVAVTATPAQAAKTNYFIKSFEVVSLGGPKSGNCNTVDVVISQTGKPESRRIVIDAAVGGGTEYLYGLPIREVSFVGGRGDVTVRYKGVRIGEPSPANVFNEAHIRLKNGEEIRDRNIKDNRKRQIWKVRGNCPDYVSAPHKGKTTAKPTYGKSDLQKQKPQQVEPKRTNPTIRR